MSDEKLKSLAYRLENLDSLRRLISELNFDSCDDPVNKEYLNENQRNLIQEARMIAKKNDYHICYIKTNSELSNQLKSISSKIIKEKLGLCLVCVHNPNGNKWMFSSLSKIYSKSFSETRHIPIEIKENSKAPETFVEFLKKIIVNSDSTAIVIHSQISNAFDEFALEIHDELTVNVFEALKTLSEGIINDKENKLILNKNTLEEVREPIFILLYRIIFILFVEDRHIFSSMSEKIYENEFSLKQIKKIWILDENKTKTLKEYEVQEYLKKLFILISEGSEALQIKPEKFFMKGYYGRLFDRSIHIKLEKWKIPNASLLKAISLLTQSKDKSGKNIFFLDYSALEIRHLGSIYENLLEFHLDEKNGKIIDLPNPKDRKKSGSYYTPKYVVDYIVENTLEPLITDIIHSNPNKIEQVDKILDLKVIDPAMGSGHFLVGVVEYLAKRICEIQFGTIEENEYSKRKRDVVRKCIYGVDYNPLSVDLAKLSLWLETISSDMPLTFLMARLKHGNSVIGEELETVFDPQHGITETDTARRKLKKTVKAFLSFEDWEDDSSNTVKAKVEKYESMIHSGSDYYQIQGLLNHKIAEGFGLEKLEAWTDVRQKIGIASLDYYSSHSEETVKKLDDKYHFFHWELEFPEVFYDQNAKHLKNPGFDVVIGNPPYAKEMENKEIFEPIKKSPYAKYYQGKMDYWYFFVQRGIDILKNGGRLGYITNRYWIKSAGASKLIERVKENLIMRKCIDFDGIKVFKKVNDKHMIHLYQKGKFSKTDETEYILLNKENFHEEIKEENKIVKKYQDVISDGNNLDFSEDIGIEFKNCEILNAFYEVSQGVVEAPDKISNKAITKSKSKTIKKGDGVFVLSKSELDSLKLSNNEKVIIKKYLNTEDVEPYKINFNDQYLIYSGREDRTKIAEGKFPNLKKHLDKFKEFITSSNGPYGIHRTRQEKYFEKPKLLCKSMFSKPEFCFDDEKYYVGFSFSSIIQKDPNYDLKYLLGILNSSLANYWFHIKGKQRGAGVDILVEKYRMFPVRIPKESEKEKVIKFVDELLKLNKNGSSQEIIEKQMKLLDEYIFEIYEVTSEQISYIKKKFS